MDAKELMIGDWVTFCGEPHKVTSIDIEFGYNITDNDNPIKPEEISPIPLTPEIISANNLVLGKNVFENKVCPFDDDTIIDIRHNVMLLDVERKEFWCLHLRNKECNCFEGGSISMNLNLLYVHQFQQALRVVGLNELADNFKI